MAQHIPDEDAYAIKARLQKEQITSLYHFTDLGNLTNICKWQGLYSKMRLENGGITYISGGNELSLGLDHRNNNWDRISLSLTPYTPMAYYLKRDRQVCCLFINTIVATWKGVEFTYTNAASNDLLRGRGIQGLNYINFKAIRAQTNHLDIEGWKKPVQAEVLVPVYIPFAYIDKIAFKSMNDIIEIQRLCGYQSKFVEDQMPFSNTWPISYFNNGFKSFDDFDILDEPY